MPIATDSSFFSSSSLFWPIISGVIGLVTVIISFLAWRSGLPRRRILCSITSRTRLLVAPKSMRDDLEVSFQSKTVANPYIAIAEVSNVGKRAISSESFTGGRALAFRLDSPILKILTVEHQPASAPKPLVVSNGNNFELRPELLVPDEIIRVSMLTEGPIGDVTLSLNPFGEVKVVTRDREKWQRQRARWGGIITACLILVLTAAMLTLTAINLIKANSNLSAAKSALKGSNCENIVSSLSDVSQSMGLLNAVVTSFKNDYGKPYGLPTSTLNGQVKILRDQASILASAYTQARRSGMRLGNSSYVVIALSRASQSVLQLEHNKSKLSVNADIVIVGDAYKAVNANGGIPQACMILVRR